MINRLKKLIVLAIMLLIVAICSGCIRENMDDLFRLPEPSREYIELQKIIDEIRQAGAVYSAPSAGSYRQSVQLRDISGDGVNEAIAFFNDYGENPLKIYIFQNIDGKYKTAAVIEGSGTGIESIAYTDMDSDGWSEVIVGWKIPDLKMLKIYSLKDYQAATIATTDYTAYTIADIDMNGRDDVIAARHSSTDNTGSVDILSIDEAGETVKVSERLSNGIESILKLTTGQLSDKSRALFVEGGYKKDGMITDVFILENGKLKCISMNDDGVSAHMARSTRVYCRDINNDGVMEIPIPRELPTQSETAYRVLDWYCYNKWGFRSVSLTTYHNNTDSWYLVLPPEWSVDITIRRDDSVSGERAVIFSIWNGPEAAPVDFLKMITLTGENREAKTKEINRIILRREGEIIYVAELLEGSKDWAYAPDEQYLKDSFSLIYSEWITGLIQ
jgi:hypothetical protein